MIRSAHEDVPVGATSILGPVTAAGPAALAVAVLVLAVIAVMLEVVRRRRHGC